MDIKCSFNDLGLPAEYTQVLIKSGITVPTPIQSLAIPLILSEKDVIAKASTGTGKTLSFLLPIFNNLSEKSSPKAYTKALILAPTRELVIQIASQAALFSDVSDMTVLAVYGGKDIDGQLKKLKRIPDIVIATPGRLLDHLSRTSLDISNLDYVIVDEADAMLESGFMTDIDVIMSYVEKKAVTSFFSATISDYVKKTAFKYCDSPAIIDARQTKNDFFHGDESAFYIPQSIRQYVILTTDREKRNRLADLLKNVNPFSAIIFCRTKKRADELDDALYKSGFNCDKIHSDLPQSKRERVMKSFKSLDLQYLIATDVVGRGLDVSGITHVINYDIPQDTESYIHRVGRTGRANADGVSFTFVTEKDAYILKKIEDAQGISLIPYTSSEDMI